jgi:hypothetical protein
MRGCTCRGPLLCLRCASLAERAGVLTPPTVVPAVSEAVFMAAVVKLAKEHGWSVYHTHDSRRSPSGFPDLVCVRGHVCLAWELKSADGIVTLQQAHWLQLLGQVTQVEAGVWRPAEWEAVVQRLRD